MMVENSRRTALAGFGSLVIGMAAFAATDKPTIAPGARKLSELMERLRRAPRRRDFSSVPMILEHPDFWDDEALQEIIARDDPGAAANRLSLCGVRPAPSIGRADWRGAQLN